MVRYILVVIAFYFVCCAMAFGQPATTDHKGATDTRLRPDMRDHSSLKSTGDDTRELRDFRKSAMDRVDSIDAPAEIGQLSFGAASPMQIPKKEPKTLKKHDRVNIIVREESQFNSQGTTDLKKNADVDAKVDSYVKLNVAKFSVEGKTPAITPEIKAELQRDFKGEGTVTRSDSFTARIGAEIVDVKPNGVLVLQAHKHTQRDEEEQDYLLTGECRAEDVQADNTVISSVLTELNLKITGKGAVPDTAKRGWVPRLLDFANPF